MLEVKNITKEYRPKKGTPVVALNNVSIKFPEKGMVFILGKSGSGKSTLLNLLGGLDKYDSGEIIIKGKSSKDFSQSEFDSYRNTYLGFIFQEYNILNEFNVAQNIALALQLQGLKATNEAVNNILDQVDLTGYGPRKPSELSGGQKQRVAIARALVKNPEIIMADEPTGALDSNTGLQVFDTLKKLSLDKLVIVITHDRDFAEMYGDRVIELKDGEVISDIEKYSAEAKKISDGVTVTDDRIISVKQGYRLTNADIDLINSYLENHDAIISVDEKSNKDLKRFARIGDDGAKESFKDTDESKIRYSEDSQFKLIKSRLPFKNSLKIGASSLKNKPVRLIFTILLSMVAFTLFGLADTMAAYNKYTATYRSIIESDPQSAVFQISKNNDEVESNGFFGGYANSPYRFTDSDIATLNTKTGMDFRPVYSFNTPSISYRLLNQRKGYYYDGDFSGYLDVDADYITKAGFNYVGTLPANNNEVAISKHFYSMFAEYGYSDPDNPDNNMAPAQITSEAAFLANHPMLYYGSEGKLTITAIIDTKFDGTKFESLKDPENINLVDFLLVSELNSTIKYGYHSLLFTHPGFIASMIEGDPSTPTLGIDLNQAGYGYYNYSYNENPNDYDSLSFYGDCSLVFSAQDLSTYCNVAYFDTSKTSVGDNEVMIDIVKMLDILCQYQYHLYQGNEEKESAITKIQNIKEKLAYHFDSLTEQDIEDLDNYLNDATNRADFAIFSNDFSYNLHVSETSKYGNVKIVGYFYSYEKAKAEYLYNSGSILVSESTIRYINDILDGYYSYAIATAPSNEGWKNLVKLTYADPENGVKFFLQNGTMETISSLNEFIEMLSKVFLYVGIGFAVFAGLMLTNFISTSISYKKREIGILRAVGARGSDVYGIFANESVIIALINFALSLIATVAIVIAIQMSFRKEYNLSISILNFGIRQVALMLAVSVGVALIASFLPTFRISRQRPVDAIKK